MTEWSIIHLVMDMHTHTCIHSLTHTHSLSLSFPPPDKHTYRDTCTHTLTPCLSLPPPSSLSPYKHTHTFSLSLPPSLQHPLPHTDTLSPPRQTHTHTHTHRVTCCLSCTLRHTWEESCIHYLHVCTFGTDSLTKQCTLVFLSSVPFSVLCYSIIYF